MVAKMVKNVIFAMDGKNTNIIQKIIKNPNVKIKSVQGKKYVHTFIMMAEHQYLKKNTLKCIKKALPHNNKIKNYRNILISLKFNFNY